MKNQYPRLARCTTMVARSLQHFLIPISMAILAICVAAPSLCVAQSEGWTPSTGVTGEAISAITIDVRGELMAATRKGVFRSTDNGASWNATSLQQITRSLTINSEGYALATVTLIPGGSGLARSSDWGVTWTIDTIGSYPKGLATDAFGSAMMVGSDSIFSSTNHGVTWQPVPNSGFTGGFFDFSRLAIGPQNELALGNQGITGGLIFYSVNHYSDIREDYWHQVNRLSGDISMLNFATTGTLFASAAENVYRSSDAGMNWAKLTDVSDTTGGGGKYFQYTVMTVHGADIYLFTNKLYRSTDDGISWTRVADLPPYPARTGMTGSVVAADGAVVAATSSGIYRWVGTSSVPTEDVGIGGMSLAANRGSIRGQR